MNCLRRSIMSFAPILKLTEIFSDMSDTQLELIASVCQEQQYNSGDLLFAENTRGDGLYVILNGEVEITVDPSLVTAGDKGEQYTIATLRRNQSFGEVALVDEGFRSASARVTQHDTRLLLIARDKLMLLCDAYPQLGYRLMRNLAADLAMKIRNTDLKVRDQLTWTHAPNAMLDDQPTAGSTPQST